MCVADSPAAARKRACPPDRCAIRRMLTNYSTVQFDGKNRSLHIIESGCDLSFATDMQLR